MAKRLTNADVGRLAVSHDPGNQSVIFYERLEAKMKNRKRQRENRRLKHKEERLDKYDGWGHKDLTPYNTIRQIVSNGKAEIALK